LAQLVVDKVNDRIGPLVEGIVGLVGHGIVSPLRMGLGPQNLPEREASARALRRGLGLTRQSDAFCLSGPPENLIPALLLHNREPPVRTRTTAGRRDIIRPSGPTQG